MNTGTEAIEKITRYYQHCFESTERQRIGRPRHVGVEYKFPLIRPDGRPAEYAQVMALFSALEAQGWRAVRDGHTGGTIAVQEGPDSNPNVVTTETGFCKLELSLAHQESLQHVEKNFLRVLDHLALGLECAGLRIIGYGIQPLAEPGEHLLMEKGRNLFWQQVFGSNKLVPEGSGDDVHLFALSASNQAHVDLSSDELIPATNVFNALSPAQIALTANSSFWSWRTKLAAKSTGEAFWDVWLGSEPRYGIPNHRFESVEDYVATMARLQPVYITRDGNYYGLSGYPTFSEFYKNQEGATVHSPDGSRQIVQPQTDDIDQHATFVWFSARPSRYCTLENRVNDQQPPEAIFSVAALTLGIIENLAKGEDLSRVYRWDEFIRARRSAIHRGLDASIGRHSIRLVSEKMLDVARRGLEKRGLGEEAYLEPLVDRAARRVCPADESDELATTNLPAFLDRHDVLRLLVH